MAWFPTYRLSNDNVLRSLNIFTPQQTSMFYETDEVLLGLHFAVLLLFAAASATLSGWYSKRYRRVKELLVAGYITITGAW